MMPIARMVERGMLSRKHALNLAEHFINNGRPFTWTEPEIARLMRTDTPKCRALVSARNAGMKQGLIAEGRDGYALRSDWVQPLLDYAKHHGKE